MKLKVHQRVSKTHKDVVITHLYFHAQRELNPSPLKTSTPRVLQILLEYTSNLFIDSRHIVHQAFDHMCPRIAMNTAQCEIINLLKHYELFCYCYYRCVWCVTNSDVCRTDDDVL